MGWGSRLPNSNDPPRSRSNPWGSKSEVFDDTAVLLSEAGARCCACQRVVLNQHLWLKDGLRYCPDHAPEGSEKLPKEQGQQRSRGCYTTDYDDGD